MKARAEFLRLFVAAAGILGCGSSPLGVAERGAPMSAGGPPNLTAAAGAPMKVPIKGIIAQLGTTGPTGQIVTPGGRCRFTAWDNLDMFTGDLSGPITFHEQVNAPCDLSDVVAAGPFDAQVTWNGRSGTINGQWTTNCTTDVSQPVGLSCGGTMNGRGAGGLEGVDFHFNWGPGWFPFDFTGTAFVH